jgi:hypothetical protein
MVLCAGSQTTGPVYGSLSCWSRHLNPLKKRSTGSDAILVYVLFQYINFSTVSFHIGGAHVTHTWRIFLP